ncbi:MAG: CinA family nicotinamide mononucleotide deamidase-related protein [Desulfobulbaceae bacterium]|nr:CinA family nicotinamide mononucleotide deamidase-related protein [Desulfobulbaceae bacterium]
MLGEIIAIGDELTSGRILNTTSYFAAGHLFAAGHEVLALSTIGDDASLIAKSLRLALSRADFTIVTGGLGATSDDLTNEAVADALGRPTIFHPEILRRIEEQCSDWAAQAGASMEKIAWLPEGAHELKSDANMAGYFLVHDGKPIFFLPGVPHEMEELLLEAVITRLAVWEGSEPRTVHQKVFKVVGLPEAAINERLGHLEGKDPRVAIGYYPVPPEVHVSLTVAGDSVDEASKLYRQFDQEIASALAPFHYGDDGDLLEEAVGKLLQEQKMTLALAESCTGGLIAHKVTAVAGSSDYFVGGVVAYSNSLKERMLAVPSEILVRHGAVSEETARAMAQGVKTATGADLAVSVTGIAGPSGGTDEKPVGTVWFALATPNEVHAFCLQFSGVRWQVQAKACCFGLDLVRRYLLDVPLLP